MPFSYIDDEPKKGGFSYIEDSSSAVIPGQPGVVAPPMNWTPKLTEEEKQAQIKAAGGKLNYGLTGVGEAALNFASQIPAQVIGVAGLGVHAAGKALGMYPKDEDSTQAASNLAGKFIYEPKTAVGKEYSDTLGEAVNRYLIPLGPAGINPGFTKLQRQAIQVQGATKAPKLSAFEQRLQAAKETHPVVESKIPMQVEGDLFNKQATQMELPFSTGVEEIAQRQRDMFNPNQTDMFLDNPGGERVPYPAEEVRNQELGAQSRQSAAQRALEDRQRALEQEVARQTTLDQNAAQRARQEKAPTGYQEWVDNQRMAAEQRLPGNNAPLDFESPYPVDASKYPDVMQEHQPGQMGLDFTQHVAEDMSRPIDKMLTENAAWEKRANERAIEDAITRRIDEKQMAMEEQLTPLEQTLRDQAYKPTGDGQGPKTRNFNRFGQGGAIDRDLLTLGLPKLVNKLHDTWVNRGENANPVIPKTGEDFIRNLPGMGDTGKDILIKGPSAEQMITDALANNVDGKLFENMQSGLAHAGEKLQSPIALNAARWFRYAQNFAAKANRDFIQPLEKSFIKLKSDGLIELSQVMEEEMFNRHPFSDETLQSLFSNPKQYEAYKQLRQEFDRALDVQNQARAKLGLDPITPQNAYMASQFRGAWHVVVKDKEGNTLWYVQNPTKWAGNNAVKYLRDSLKDHPDIDINSIQVKYEPNKNFNSMPRDSMGIYQDMLKLYKDDPRVSLITEALEQYMKDTGTKALRQDYHQVDHKANVRGFEGDKPWLSDKRNAHDWARGQLDYLANAHRWAALQEAVYEVSQVLSHPEIAAAQPNNIALTKAYMLKHMGISQNVFKGLADFLAKSTGASPTIVNDVVTKGLKPATYAGLIAFSPGYIIATPLQAVSGSLAWVQKLAKDGYIKPDGVADFMKGLGTGTGAGLTFSDVGLSGKNKEMFHWAVENAVLQKSLFDEYANLGTHGVINKAMQATNFTMSRPDQATRAPLFFAFGKLLEDSGKFKTKQEAWQRASEITEHIMTNMRGTDRPLWVDKMGSLGDAAYVFKAPAMNFYNTISMFAHNGNYKGMAAYLAAFAVMGGIMNLPGVSELDGTLNLLKDGLSHWSAGAYNAMKNVDIRKFMLEQFQDVQAMNKIMNYGLPSYVTNVNFASRFNQSLLDVEHPLSTFSPLGQEVKEWIGAAKLVHPTKTTVADAAYAFAPPLGKGLLETYNDAFKSPSGTKPNGNQLYRNPHKLEDTKPIVERSPDEQRIRQFGVMALSEADRRSKDWINTSRNIRDQNAIKTVQSSLWDAINRHDSKDIERYVNTYTKLDPQLKDLNSFITTKVGELGMTPQQWQAAHAKSILQIQSLVRRQQMQ